MKLKLNALIMYLIQFKSLKILDKTLKGISGVRLDKLKVVCAPGPRTKYVERFLSFKEL